MRRRRLLAEQRGAISILAGLSLTFVVASAGMAVDVGQAAWQKRSLQRLVDVVSLDAVRALGDRKDPVGDPYAKALQFAQEASTRNEFDYDDATQDNTLTVELGLADATTKAFTPAAPSDYGIANAVRVTATHRVDHHLMPGSATLSTEAIAMVEPAATFSVGSRAARVDTTSSPVLNGVLGQMLGAGVSLDAASYNGLADATVTFGDVWGALGLGSTSQILTTEVTVKDFLIASASALNDQGDATSVAAASTLGTLATQVDSTITFTFGEMIEAQSGDPGDAANARIDVLGLVGMAAQFANGDNLMSLTLPVTIPGVTTTTMKFGLIEKPAVATGPARKDANGNWVTRAHTAQARIQLDLTLAQKLTVLLQQGTVHLPVYLEAAGADGELTAVQCAIPETDSRITVHTTTQALSAKVGQATDGSLTDPSGPAVVGDGQIVGIAGLVNVTGTAAASVPAAVGDLSVLLNQIASLGAGGGGSVALAGGLQSSLALTVQVLGLGVNASAVASDTLAILNPVLSTLDSTLFDVLSEALASIGIELGGADVSNLDTRCGRRRLIG